jgi:hypothetical protein
MQDFLEVFKEKFEEYSPNGALELRYELEKGMHTVVGREVVKGESVFDMPCQYMLSICRPYHPLISCR